MEDYAAKFISEFFGLHNLGIIQIFILDIYPTRPEIRLFPNWATFLKCFSVGTSSLWASWKLQFFRTKWVCEPTFEILR